MFGTRKEIELGRIVPTSKMTLKLSCLAACGNDVEEAKKLYDYIAKDLVDLPDLDPSSPSILQRADGIFDWIGQHRDDLAQGISMIQNIRSSWNGGPAVASASAAGVAAPIKPGV